MYFFKLHTQVGGLSLLPMQNIKETELFAAHQENIARVQHGFEKKAVCFRSEELECNVGKNLSTAAMTDCTQLQLWELWACHALGITMLLKAGKQATLMLLFVAVGGCHWDIDLPNMEIQLKRLVVVTEGVEKEFQMKVKGGLTMELCLQLLWLSNPELASVVANIEFHSLNCHAPTLVLSHPLVISAAREFAQFGASTNLPSKTLNPKASLSTV
jgi:hypothetical protein